MPQPTQHPTRFASHLELARLPWFEVRDGRLRLRDPEVGPMIDVHTHLALSFGTKPATVDLHREHPRTEHYLPVERPIDLDVYINKNFTAEDLARAKRDLSIDSLRDRGMRRTHTAPNLAREMADLGVVSSVLLPIDFPFLSRNADTWLAAAARTPGLLSMGSVHPYTRGVRGKLERQKAAGARGVKVHPAVQMIKPDARRPMELYRHCGELGLPVLFHCGPVDIETRLGRYLSQVRHYVAAVRDNPDTLFVLGHSGALQMEQALELARTCDNVWLELASQSISNIRTILKQGPTDRVMSGSDWPFYHQATAMAKVLIATDGDPVLRRKVMWQNAARLFDLEVEPARRTA